MLISIRPRHCLILSLGLTLIVPAASAADRLTARRLPAAAPLPHLATGAEVRTEAGQRKRTQLPGGAILYVNEQTTVRLEGPRVLTITAGEVYVEGAPDTKDELVIRAGGRELTARGASIALRFEQGKPAIEVSRGEVSVRGLKRSVVAGQRLAANADEPTPAPRASHSLPWLRELMPAALVPASQHAGGELLVVDADGQEAKLTLRKFVIDVHIEDGFARTTIDQTYFNDRNEQLEGTFYFPLPADASLSRLAMYVDGNLMEGGMAERDHAREVYETIRYARRDPALLEWVDGTTFKMRVFPLEPRTEKRVLLSYTQRLPVVYGQAQYRFPAGHSLQEVRELAVNVRVKGGAGRTWNSLSHSLKARDEVGDLILSGTQLNARTDRDLVLTVAEPERVAVDGEAVSLSSFDHEGARYLLARYRPTLQATAQAGRRDWTFLVETSGDRDPLLARAQIEVLRHLLLHASPDDAFNVLAANTRVRSFAPDARPITPENIAAAIAFLEDAHLIGALDLGQALTEASTRLAKAQNPHLVHLGTGIAAMGERRAEVLARSLPPGARYVGVAVGKRWDRAFMKTAAEHTGGLFTQINPDEPLAWRAFELATTVTAPRLLDVRVVDPTGKAKFHAFAQSLSEGEELAAVTRIDGKSLPETIAIHGTLDGKPFQRELRVRNVTDNAGYLPRTWAKLEIDRLLSESAADNKDKIIALSKAMYVITPFTSLLVLENEDLYTQYHVDRGRKDHWALYPAPVKIPVVVEPEPGQPDPRELKASGKKSRREVLTSLHQGLHPTDDVVPRFPSILGQPMQSGVPVSEYDSLNIRDLHTGSLMISGLQRNLEVPSSPTPLRLGSVNRTQVERLAERNLAKISFEALGTDRTMQARNEPLEEIGQGFLSREVFADSHSNSVRTLIADADGPPSGNTPSFPATESGIANAQSRGLALARSRRGPRRTYPVGDLVILGDLSGKESRGSGGLYTRPTVAFEPASFAGLVTLAPGLTVDLADVEAVIAAEALPGRLDRLGEIDAAARELIAKARAQGWQKLTFVDEPNRPGFTIRFNGDGQFAWERTLGTGLRENVVNDGKTLTHSYPQLGLAAQRDFSPFHLAEMADLIPWLVPSTEHLARGADVRVVAPRTVAIVPHGPKTPRKDADGKPLPVVQARLVFGTDGRLVERQLVRGDEVLLRLTLAANGTTRLVDAKGKELATQMAELAASEAPVLTVDTKDLLVLPLPYRTAEHVTRTLKLENRQPAQLTLKEALPLMLASVAAGNGNQANNIFRQAIHARNQRQLGYYVLLASVGVNLDSENGDVQGEHPHEPLAQYLALHTSPALRKHASQWAVAGAAWKDPFLRDLTTTHALLQRWQQDRVLKGDAARVQADIRRAADFVRGHRDTEAGWALACLMQDRATAAKDLLLHAELAGLFHLFRDAPGLDLAARYEEARSLWRAGKAEEARKQFRDLYEMTLKDGRLPAIDTDFRLAMLGGDGRADLWNDLIPQTARKLIADKKRPAVFALAQQCWQLEDAPLVQQLLAQALAGVDDGKDRKRLTQACVLAWRAFGQFAEADRLLQTLLDDVTEARRPELWRLAAELAGKRDMDARAVECLERALDLEGRNPPEVIDLTELRTDYHKLMTHYENLANAMVSLKLTPPADFPARVIRAADRWRALDSEVSGPCDAAARILKRLGDRDLSWDYLTTPVAMQPNEATRWRQLGAELARQGELELADRAHRAACDAEPTNAQLLWDRAQNLRQAGRQREAEALFRRIAEGTWQPRFQGLQTQARQLVTSS